MIQYPNWGDKLQHKLKIDDLHLYFNIILQDIDNKNLTSIEFKEYYCVFKEFLYSWLFDLDILLKFAEKLLNCTISIKLDEIDNLEICKQELKKIILFIKNSKIKNIEKFDNVIIKKTYQK